MKLKIEKNGDQVKIEVATDPNKKPIAVEMTALQLENLIGLMQTAAKCKVFAVQLDL